MGNTQHTRQYRYAQLANTFSHLEDKGFTDHDLRELGIPDFIICLWHMTRTGVDSDEWDDAMDTLITEICKREIALRDGGI